MTPGTVHTAILDALRRHGPLAAHEMATLLQSDHSDVSVAMLDLAGRRQIVPAGRQADMKRGGPVVWQIKRAASPPEPPLFKMFRELEEA